MAEKDSRPPKKERGGRGWQWQRAQRASAAAAAAAAAPASPPSSNGAWVALLLPLASSGDCRGAERLAGWSVVMHRQDSPLSARAVQGGGGHLPFLTIHRFLQAARGQESAALAGVEKVAFTACRREPTRKLFELTGSVRLSVPPRAGVRRGLQAAARAKLSFPCPPSHSCLQWSSKRGREGRRGSSGFLGVRGLRARAAGIATPGLPPPPPET